MEVSSKFQLLELSPPGHHFLFLPPVVSKTGNASVQEGLPTTLAGCASNKIITVEPIVCRVGRGQNLHWGTGRRVNDYFLIDLILSPLI